MLVRCLQTRIGNWILALFVLACLTLRAYSLLALLTTRFITGADGTGHRGTILGLSSHRFRGDLACLEKAGYKVLRIHPDWVSRISTLIFRLPIQPGVVFLKRSTPEVDQAFERLNHHLIPFFFVLLDCECL